MGMVVMSKRELNRLDVLARLDSDRLTARAAAELMTITPRQTYRLLRRYRDGGASAVANQRRGRPSNNRLPDVGPDQRLRASLVRGSCSCLHVTGVRRRCDKPPNGASFCPIREHICLFRGAEGLSSSPRQTRRLLLRQAFHLSGVEREGGQRQWNDPVRTGFVRTQYRDSVRQYQPGEGTRRA